MMTVSRSTLQASPAIPESRAYRPELQGLRAVAVLLVAIYHIWFGRVSGGVDVFFVVSGFLITRSLLAQVEQYGQVQFGRYFNSLATRLLPTAMVVLLASVLAAAILLPTTLWIDTIKSAAAALLYVENWYLAFQAVDYLATDTRVPFQQYWALSVQGQFYALWALAFTLVACAARFSSAGLRRITIVLLCAVFVTSLAYSVYATATYQAFAYFNTFARTWEFALGGLTALALPWLAAPSRVRLLAGWSGLALILSCGIVLQVSTVFPGYAALWPTLGAALVIVAGNSGHAWGVDRLLASRPISALGDISYALFLWHWPVFVFYLVYSGHDTPGLAGGAAILLVSTALAWLTTHLVEQPLRFSRGLRGLRLWQTASFAVACAVPVVLALSVWSVQALSARSAALVLVSADDPAYPGAMALFDDTNVDELEAAPLYPGPFRVRDDRPVSYPDDCHQTQLDGKLIVCRYGQIDGARTIALVGDSHAAQWLPTLQMIAHEHDWTIFNLTKAACWFNLEPRAAYREHHAACKAWNDEVMAWLRANRPDVVFTIGTTVDDDGEHVPPGYLERWAELDRLAIPVLAMRDTPRHAFDPAVCVDVYGASAARCRTPRERILDEDNPLGTTAAVPSNVHLLDLTSLFCDETECFPVAGNVLIYRDAQHFTSTYARTLKIPLTVAIGEVLPGFVDQASGSASVEVVRQVEPARARH